MMTESEKREFLSTSHIIVSNYFADHDDEEGMRKADEVYDWLLTLVYLRGDGDR